MNDGELIRAVRSGRNDAYTSLVERHQERVYRLCYGICGNAADADTLAHDAFIEAYLKLDQLRDPDRFGPWLRAVALNLCRMWYRQSRRLSELPIDEPVCERPDGSEYKDGFTAVHRGLSLLSASHRLVLVLHYWEGLSYEETARFLDVPIGTVMSRLHRARHELKRLIEKIEEEEETMPPTDDFKREVEAEIRVLLGLLREDPQARERLSVLLTRAPEHWLQRIREAEEDPQALDDLALLLGRLGVPAVETTLAAYFGADRNLRANAARLLARFVARGGAPGTGGATAARIAGRGIYLLMDHLIRFPAVSPGAKVELLAGLLAEKQKEERTALLLVNTLLCWPEAALPVLLERYWQAEATPGDVFRTGDILHALCRMGTRFAAALIPPLQAGDEPQRQVRALFGAEALARTLHCDWLDLDTVPDEQVALDARFRRKWPLPLRADRDPAVLHDLAAVVAPFTAWEGDTRSRETRERAVRTLGYLRARDFLEPVLSVARDTAIAPTTRVTALRALADIADPRAAAFIRETTRSADPAERRLAVEALGNLAQPQSLPLLAEMRGDPDREVRRAVLFALRQIGSEEALTLIQQTAASGDPSVREAAARALSSMRHKQTGSADVVAEQPERSDFRMADVVREGAKPPQFISLEAALRALPEERRYTEPEITRLIAQACIDYSSTRRYLIEEGLLRREAGIYEMTEAGRTAWRVERFIRDHYMR